MRLKHDHLAKLVLQQALDAFGKPNIQEPVPSLDSQFIDVWFVLGLVLASPPEYLRLLCRLFFRDSIIEPFSDTINRQALRHSQRKQLVWHGNLELLAKKRRERLPPLPPLWLLSRGRPRTIFREFDVRELDGCPEGIYEVGRGYQVYLIVVSELPRTRETLVLRLMGSPRSRREALAELSAVPLTDVEGEALRDLRVCLQRTVAHDTQIGEQERRDIMTAAMAELQQLKQKCFEEGVETGVKKGIRKGIEQGVEKTLRQAVLDLCEVVGVEVTAHRRAEILALDKKGLERLRQGLKQTRSWPSGSAP